MLRENTIIIILTQTNQKESFICCQQAKSKAVVVLKAFPPESFNDFLQNGDLLFASTLCSNLIDLQQSWVKHHRSKAGLAKVTRKHAEKQVDPL